MNIGFSILAHRNPMQLLRLVTALNRLYGHPPIACHFDFSQSYLDKSLFPSNVAFVDRWVPTGWAKWSVVDATLRTLQLLRQMARPQWVVHLSGADYPLAPADVVVADLKAATSDAFLDFREAGMNAAEAEEQFGPINPALTQFEADKNIAVRRAHYLGFRYWIPVLRREKRGLRLGRQTYYLPFDSPTAPFSSSFKCYYGDHWFTINHRALDVILQPTENHLHLRRHLKSRFCPEECYYHTVLCNEPSIVVERNNRRYARWNGGGAHPANLGLEDLSNMLSSGAHFARKFSDADAILDEIDSRLLERRTDDWEVGGDYP